MELTITKRDFLRGLARTHAVADRKSSMPVLSNVLLASHAGDVLRLSATDMYLGVTTHVPARIEKGGTLALSARTLFDIVKALPEGEIKLETSDNGATLKAGKVKYKLPTAAADDFPPLPSAQDVPMHEVDIDLLHELIQLTAYSMSTDDTRPHLAGTLFEGDAKILRMVTTDGHRLSKAERKTGDATGLYNFRMLLPHKGIGELKRLLEDLRSSRGKGEEGPFTIHVGHQAGNAFFRREGLLLSVKLADEQFPPYEKVIPQRHSRRAVAPRAALIEALRRIQLVASDKSGGVLLRIENGLMRVQSQSSEVGEGVEELDIDYAGDPVSIGFNARYVLDVLSAIASDEVAFELSGELDPGMIKPVGDGVDFVGVIMPMRI